MEWGLCIRWLCGLLFFMGSGLYESEGNVVAVAPCHTTEGIYTKKTDSGSYVSNSIALLLKVSGCRLDIHYKGYEADALTLKRGLGANKADIVLADGETLRSHHFCNLTWDTDGKITEWTKPPSPTFASYEEYRSFLSAEAAGISGNASDPRRIRPLEPIVFCSNGYDSTACAVLAREVGCTEAVVYESKKNTRSDSGIDIVRLLGFDQVHEKEEISYMDTESSALFLSTGELGSSIFFAAAADELAGKLLFSGAHGDLMWSTTHLEGERKIQRCAYPDSARSEFRLHVGYVTFPPAFLTALRQPHIHSISTGPEMALWRLFNDYDRPIPRRIAEDAGVPREMFGMTKNGGAGSSLRFGNIGYLSRTMPPADYQRFRPYWLALRSVRGVRGLTPLRSARYLAFSLAMLLRLRNFPLLARLLRIDAWPEASTCSPFAPSGLFVWAVDTLHKTSYREAHLNQ